MNTVRSLLVLCAFVLTCTATSAAQAQDTEEALTATAKELFDAASAASDEGRFDECYAKAKAAWGVQQHYKIAGGIGDCAQDVGRHLEAAQNLRYFLEHRPATLPPEVLKYMQKRLGEAKTKIATVTISCNVPDATIRIDGNDVPAGKETFLEPGAHAIEAEAAGHEPAARNPELAAGAEQTIELTLTPTAPTPPGNGAPLDGSDGISIVWPIATGAVALVGFGIGIGGLVGAGGAQSDVDELNDKLDALAPEDNACKPTVAASLAGDCSSLQDAVGDHGTFERMAIAGFVVGGAMTATTIVLLLFTDFGGDDDSPAPSEDALRVGPVMTPSTQGLVLQGAW